jgi:hypothetical protein
MATTRNEILFNLRTEFQHNKKLNNYLRNSMATTSNEILFNLRPEFQHNKNHQQKQF